MEDVEKVISYLREVKHEIKIGNASKSIFENSNAIDCAIQTIRELREDCNRYHEWGFHEGYEKAKEQIPKWHLVADGEFPEDLEIVNVVWCNHNPPIYYQNIKDKRFVASAVYFKGKWYWYSSACIDYLEEYGKNDFDLIDDDVEVIAWQELPKFEEVE